MTLYTLPLLDFRKRLFLCKYFIVQYGVGLPGAFKQYFVYLQTIWGVQRWSGPMNPVVFFY